MVSTDVRTFLYLPFELSPDGLELTCPYEVGGHRFTERFRIDRTSLAGCGGRNERDHERDHERDLVKGTAGLVHLLAGVSYYKTSAPPVVDVGGEVAGASEAEFLRHFYVEGLGEFAYRNQLDLSGLQVTGDALRAGEEPAPVAPGEPAREVAPMAGRIERPLVPFGGGIDSIVVAEAVRRRIEDVALLVVEPPGPRLAAIEEPAAVTGLPVLRVTRQLDDKVLRSAELGFLNGHVPVTGILSAVAAWAATRAGRDAVVMANEWSASAGNVRLGGREVNHQYSKGRDFEDRFRRLLGARTGGAVQYFSLLRSRSELWVAQRFAGLRRYHGAFRSCNRAFHVDPAARLERWCGGCDKCCFIDLVLAPFLGRRELEEVFAGREPLDDPTRLPVFLALLGTEGTQKPFECVGEPDECRAAAVAASSRPDRAGNALLEHLAAHATRAGAPPLEALLGPMGPDHVPDDLAAALG